jgi:hypothetical protein
MRQSKVSQKSQQTYKLTSPSKVEYFKEINSKLTMNIDSILTDYEI